MPTVIWHTTSAHVLTASTARELVATCLPRFEPLLDAPRIEPDQSAAAQKGYPPFHPRPNRRLSKLINPRNLTCCYPHLLFHVVLPPTVKMYVILNRENNIIKYYKD